MSIGSLYVFPAAEKIEAHPSRSSSGMGIQKVRGSQDAEEWVGLRMENSIITLGLRHCDEDNRLLLSWSRLKGSWLPQEGRVMASEGRKALSFQIGMREAESRGDNSQAIAVFLRRGERWNRES